MEEKYLHNPVLIEEVLDFLDLAPGKIIVDATIGGGGHAEQILQKISPGGMLIGIDRDPESLRIAHERLKPMQGSFKLINRNFRDIKEIISDLKIGEIDGLLFDLGISGIQMGTPERGFSIKNPGPLDMRMDRNQSLTAKDLVNRLTERELSVLIKDFGEERFHKRIAKAIVDSRRHGEIKDTAELAAVICGSLPYGRRGRIHPATRTFQALRIAVNQELEAIEGALKDAAGLLRKGGRICVISFHSLEDRIVKHTFREFKAKGVFRIVTKKPVTAKWEEVSGNPRSRSAKLRAAIKL